jgi:G3E family GTPase
MLLHLGGVRVTWVRSFTTTPSRTLLRPYVPWVLSSSSTSSTLFSTASKTSASSSSDTPSSKIPVTLLAGFLGAGKTSTLQNLLLNNVGAKIGVIVNDVPSINIDAKMIAHTAVLNQQGLSSTSPLVLNGDDTIELNNGCACCSLADELLGAIQKLTQGGTRSFDAIVVELTGVADPMAVKNNWEQAVEMMHPATQVSQVNRVVTLVDACTFGTDWMTWDTSGDRKNWVSEGDECSAARHVPELLAEQVEAANLILINKVDLAEPGQVLLSFIVCW